MAEQTTFEVAAYTAGGTTRDRVTLPAETFDGTVNVPVMHQAVKAFLANQRQANAHTKTRSFVTGGNAKPWKQKGTGRARQGSTRAPNWVGGGTVFGPSNQRNYKEDVPKQVRQLARKSALNARAREESVFVIDRFAFETPQTRRMAALIARLGLAGKKVLILTDGSQQGTFLSARNLPTVHVMPFVDASTYHVLWSDAVLLEASAIGQELAPVAETQPEVPARKAPPAAAPVKKAARKAAPAKAAAKKADKKTAAKKATAKKASATKATAKKGTSGKAGQSAARKSTAKKATAKKSAARTPAAKKSPKKKGS